MEQTQLPPGRRTIARPAPRPPLRTPGKPAAVPVARTENLAAHRIKRAESVDFYNLPRGQSPRHHLRHLPCGLRTLSHGAWLHLARISSSRRCLRETAPIPAARRSCRSGDYSKSRIPRDPDGRRPRPPSLRPLAPGAAQFQPSSSAFNLAGNRTQTLSGNTCQVEQIFCVERLGQPQKLFKFVN